MKGRETVRSERPVCEGQFAFGDLWKQGALFLLTVVDRKSSRSWSLNVDSLLDVVRPYSSDLAPSVRNVSSTACLSLEIQRLSSHDAEAAVKAILARTPSTKGWPRERRRRWSF